MKIKILILCFSFFCIKVTLSATDYYVSNAGNNSNAGTQAAPFLTLQHAADVVTAGDNVFVENGTYAGFDLRTSGTAANPITFKALGFNVLINSPTFTNDGINIENADYIILDGFIVNDQPRNGIRLVLANHCIVRNCRCDNNFERGIFTGFTDDILIEYNVCTNAQDEHGIYVSNSSDRPIIRYNECFGNKNIGIHMNGDLSAGGDGIISDAQIYGNLLHDNNAAAGLNMDGCLNPVVYNNVIYNNHFAQGIALFQGDGAIATRGAKIYNNTIIVPTDGRWGILLNTGANVDTEIYNNIILNFHSFRGSITTESINQLSSDYNILSNKMSNMGDGSSFPLSQWQALGLDEHSKVAMPLSNIFEDAANDNYQLNGTTSQAYNMGDAALVNSIVTDDILGVARPMDNLYDIGAYEYQSALGITKEEEESEKITILPTVQVSPNPFTNELVLSFKETNERLNGTFDYKIYNIKGQLVQSGQITTPRIEVANLKESIYLLEISNHIQRVIVREWVVKRPF